MDEPLAPGPVLTPRGYSGTLPARVRRGALDGAPSRAGYFGAVRHGPRHMRAPWEGPLVLLFLARLESGAYTGSASGGAWWTYTRVDGLSKSFSGRPPRNLPGLCCGKTYECNLVVGRLPGGGWQAVVEFTHCPYTCSGLPAPVCACLTSRRTCITPPSARRP